MQDLDGGVTTVLGDAEISEIGSLLADRARCRVLMALNDGRALPASVLADEAGITRSTASSHLGKLADAGLLQVETHGRHRYYRLAGPQVGELLEILVRMAPAHPVRSLRDGNRAARLRQARTCYDHLAGRLGVDLMASVIKLGFLTGGDGIFHPELAEHDKVRGYGSDLEYSLDPAGERFLTELGVQLPVGKRRFIRYCVDWSEQRHHLAGALGRALLERFLQAEWVVRQERGRSLRITPAGRDVLLEQFDISWQ
ncbi:ArsR/SmtB family transcription factor [Kitasatospora viridis]|uniref:DNA-binding transcriptional ArsR family regulator n=1 Tax=Kitasatospora viridis TaxID=281105 RepID=A0A561T7A8_9ACTN|nr:metalloregulator ArsR/SmtB family transcription factor [Kitasatospora viridis]TWF82996.1 DNA-binding transcriptional ArsR family regulator [Kitasatospora viridis]